MLRIGFGLLWVLDGVLQAQPRMAAGLPSQVIEPAAASSPHWVQHLVNWAGTDVVLPPDPGRGRGGMDPGRASGCGCWPRRAVFRPGWPGWPAWPGAWSSGCSANPSAGSSPPGLTWLSGAPGAALIYAVAGGLLALPDAELAVAAAGPGDTGRAGAVPDRHGGAAGLAGPGLLAGPRRIGQPGTLTGMIQSDGRDVAAPRVLSSLVSGFESLIRDHGFAVNLVAVAALAVIGAAFLTGPA